MHGTGNGTVHARMPHTALCGKAWQDEAKPRDGVGLRIKDLLRKLQFLRKGEQLLWEPIDQRRGDRVAQSGLGPT